jgi:GTP-binding protein YchF
MIKPRKTIFARITYTDVAGHASGTPGGAGLDGALLNHLATHDGFVHVVRAFDNPSVPHPGGEVDPQRDLAALETEFLLSDLGTVERRIERIDEGLRKGAAKDKGLAQKEMQLFEQLLARLSAEQPLRDLDLGEEQLKELRGYGLLTLKPQIIVVNIGDDQAEVSLAAAHTGTTVVNLRGKLEMELAQLSADGDVESLELFMEEYGVSELGLDRLVKLSYDLLGLQSFFTVGEDEVRAWTVNRGATAVEAAAVIHTDLAKGFIRAETVHYNDLVAAGSLANARTAGKLRQEGKTYEVQDGDVINVKFNL